ncbi:MAG: serine/threonine protein kinase [Nitrososphaeraceae archaeon]|nr:serine/threonine protein kinase [Nitrososphaeraceae archaeon]
MSKMRRIVISQHTYLLLFLTLLANIFLYVHYYNYQQSTAQTINTSSEDIARITTAGYLTYKNSMYGFEIQYPSNWEKIDFGQTIEEDDRNIVVTFLSPPEDALDIFREYLVIQVGEVMFNRSLEQYVDTQINSLRDSLPDFGIVESNATTVASNRAHIIVYTFKVGEDEYKVTEFWIIKGDKLYYLKYSTESEKSDNHGSTIRKMIDSFRIIS